MEMKGEMFLIFEDTEMIQHLAFMEAITIRFIQSLEWFESKKQKQKKKRAGKL